MGKTRTSFGPGNCANPKGRPKAIVDVQLLARTQTKQNIERLMFWRDQDDDPATAVRATIALHEIAWGKPSQAVQHQSSEGGPLEIILSWQNQKANAKA